ncbi:DUF2508 family protein [Paenibacillus chartarius]|uniref:DUF2508 family protein n=1 Tax=Paenibacillus chartarius TaxID=747481 RepID=A0ABV6DS39_9BACL
MQLKMLRQWMQPRRQRQERERNEKYELYQEVRKAHADWEIAQTRLDYAVSKDEIDYAIYALEAAEKRYEMLIKAAKQAKLSLIDSDKVMEAGGA